MMSAFTLVIILINDVLKNGARKMLPTSECLYSGTMWRDVPCLG